jgi:hypothetical protein
MEGQMVDLTAVQAAFTGLKTAGDIAKTFLSLNKIADIQAKVIELQSVILSAQGSALAAQNTQSALLERIRELEEAVAKVKAWDAEKQKYELKEVSPNSFAYVLKTEASGTEPTHWICASCYEHGKKSILQGQGNGWGVENFKCAECKGDIKIRRPSQHVGPFQI